MPVTLLSAAAARAAPLSSPASVFHCARFRAPRRGRLINTWNGQTDKMDGADVGALRGAVAWRPYVRLAYGVARSCAARRAALSVTRARCGTAATCAAIANARILRWRRIAAALVYSFCARVPQRRTLRWHFLMPCVRYFSFSFARFMRAHVVLIARRARCYLRCVSTGVTHGNRLLAVVAQASTPRYLCVAATVHRMSRIVSVASVLYCFLVRLWCAVALRAHCARSLPASWDNNDGIPPYAHFTFAIFVGCWYAFFAPRRSRALLSAVRRVPYACLRLMRAHQFCAVINICAFLHAGASHFAR